MGVTIHWKLAQQKKYVEQKLKEIETAARQIKEHQADKLGIPFMIRRGTNFDGSKCQDDFLAIDIGQCETLMFDFKPMSADEMIEKSWLRDLAWFERQHQGEHYERWPDQKLLWCTGFCKTQFANNLVEHKWVADLLRLIASRCSLSIIDDEGDYCHTGNIDDAAEAISSLGVMMNSMMGKLAGSGYEVIQGGKTAIKSRKRKQV